MAMLLQANSHILSCSFDVMLMTGFASGLLSVFIGGRVQDQQVVFSRQVYTLICRTDGMFAESYHRVMVT